MSIHLRCDHRCAKCREEYVPFDEENRCCPKCGTAAREVEPLVPRALRAAWYNNEWGVYADISTGDMYVSWAMHALRMRAEAKMEVPKCEADLESVCERLLEYFNFAGYEYKRSYTKAFIRALLREAYLKPGN